MGVWCGRWAWVGTPRQVSKSPGSALLPFFLGGEIDCRKKGTLILTSLLEDLVSSIR